MTELHPLVGLVIVAGTVAGSLGAIAAIGVKVFRVVRAVDEHFRRRESERIEAAAGRLIDRAAQAIGSRLDHLNDQVAGLAANQDAGRELVAEWEVWRAGVDVRLDRLEGDARSLTDSALRAADRTS